MIFVANLGLQTPFEISIAVMPVRCLPIIPNLILSLVVGRAANSNSMNSICFAELELKLEEQKFLNCNLSSISKKVLNLS